MRVGKLVVGSDTYDLRLHPTRPMPYRPQYQTVWPTYDYGVAGRSGTIGGDPNIRIWHIDGWSEGEGDDLFDPDASSYNYSTNCRPKPNAEGVVLGALQTVTVNNAAQTFADGGCFGLALGKLWAGLDGTLHYWDTSTNAWHTVGYSSGVAVAAFLSIVDGSDESGTYDGVLYASHTNKKIYKVTSGTNAVQYDTGTADDFDMAPLLASFDGVVYALDTDGLYRLDKSADDTRTQVVAVGCSAATYDALGVATSQRISCSDKGPIWIEMEDSGQTILWEYNAATDSGKKIGKLPVDFAMPYSIAWANGFYFVGFRYADRDAAAGDAYIYYQRGAQRGVAGPIRNLSASSASAPVRIGGVIGDDLIFYFDGAVWAYNLSSGGIYQFAKSTTTNTTAVRHCVCFGQEVFLAYVNNTGNAERFAKGSYTTGTARLASGRFDFGFQGIDKILLDVTVVTEPLPANTQITLEVATEGGTAAAVTGTFTGDGATTSYTWTVSSSTTSVVGRDFELFLIPKTTSTSVTPTVRSITARAIGAEQQRSWVLELDPGTWSGGSEGYSPRSADVLAGVKAIGESNALCQFQNPWDGEEWDAAVNYTVKPVTVVSDVVEGSGVVQLELREAAYV